MYRLSIAPMLDWTDRHCRFFHRLLAPTALLYTEMVTVGALTYSDPAYHLQYHPIEKPVVLQLGGSDPVQFAACAKLAEQYGFDEINLNCGCPSERVQKGAFGACLMPEPELVADCWRAMRQSCRLPITIKHRIGIDNFDDYAFLHAFVACLADAGCQTFVVHARKAILKGLSPKENRQIPPLCYDFVYRLKTDFTDRQIIINGGINNLEDVRSHLAKVDGVMIGREAYTNPLFIYQLDQMIGARQSSESREVDADPGSMSTATERAIFDQYFAYCTSAIERGDKLSSLIKPLLGWRRGSANARYFRRILSDQPRLRQNDLTILEDALACFLK